MEPDLRKNWPPQLLAAKLAAGEQKLRSLSMGASAANQD